MHSLLGSASLLRLPPAKDKGKKKKPKTKRGCCHINKNQRCGLFIGIVVAGGVAAYIGGVESANPEEVSVVEPGTGGTVVAGMFGYTVGPLMLIYGYKVTQTSL